MNIIYLVAESLSKTASGAGIRNFSISLALSKVGKVKVISLTDFTGNANIFTTNNKSKVVNDIDLAVQGEIINIIRQEKPTIIVAAGVFFFDVVMALKKDVTLKHIPIINDAHNMESALLEESDRIKYPAFLQCFLFLVYSKRWREARNFEKEMAYRLAATWVTSNDDKKLFQSILNSKQLIEVVSNPIPRWCETSIEQPPVVEKKPNATSLLYVGHLGYGPNKKAIDFLLSKVMPRLIKSDPKFELTVCGRNPRNKLKKHVAQLSYANLVENPEDITPFYQKADLTVMPIFFGGGTRIKVLEALAMGIPIVATRKAVEGIDLVPGQHFLKAENAKQFVDAILKLKNDTELRARLIKQGRSFVYDNHSQKIIDQQVAKHLENMFAN